MRIAILPPPRLTLTFREGAPNALGGIEGACVGLARALAARGHDVALGLTPNSQVEARAVAALPMDAAAAEGTDALIACADARLFMPRAARRVLWMHNPLSFEKAVRKRQWAAHWRWRPHAVFGGAYALADCSKFFPFASRAAIPLGIDEAFLAPPPPPDGPRDKFVFVTQAHRGLADALAAWEGAAARLPPAIGFDVYGADPAMVGWDAERAAAARVRFLPRADKAGLRAAYAGAIALVCLGARDETFCLAAAEASACGLPVLTFGIGALAERVRDGDNGLVARDVDGLGADMLRVAGDAALWGRLNAGALARRAGAGWASAAALWEAHLAAIPSLRG